MKREKYMMCWSTHAVYSKLNLLQAGRIGLVTYLHDAMNALNYV